jgi:hypothetical protein
MNYLNGGSWQLVGEFTEVESGKHSDRPQLEAALAACKKHRATAILLRCGALFLRGEGGKPLFLKKHALSLGGGRRV